MCALPGALLLSVHGGRDRTMTIIIIITDLSAHLHSSLVAVTMVSEWLVGWLVGGQEVLQEET